MVLLLQGRNSKRFDKKIFINSEIAYLYELLENSEEALKYLYIAKDLGRNDGWIYLHLYHNLKTTKGEEEALKYFEEKNIEYIHGIVGCTVGIHSGTKACGVFFIEK